MSYIPYLIVINLTYILMVWFFVSLVLSLLARSKSKKVLSSLTLFLMWAFYSYIFKTKGMDHLTDPQAYEVVAWFELIFALLLTMWLKGSMSSGFVRTLPEWLRYDSVTWVYAIIILFGAICHFFMLDDVVLLLEASKNSTKYTPSIIYFWYSELIILTQVLQLLVATYGMVGMVGDIRSLRKDNRVLDICANGYNKDILLQEAQAKTEDRT